MKVNGMFFLKLNRLAESFLFFILIIQLGLFLGSCKQEGTGDRPISPETAKMISQVSSGLLKSTDPVKVIFVDAMVDENLTGQTLKKNVFDFDPSIDGTTRWLDRRTLIFKPNRPLPLRGQYHVKLDLNALFPRFREQNLQDLEFTFQVAGREIGDFDAELKLVDQDNPEQVFLEGRVAFTEEIDLAQIKKATEAEINGGELSLNWSEAENQRIFVFKSQTVRRGDSEKRIVFTISRDETDISHDFRRTFIIPAIRAFTVTDVITEEEGKQPHLRVKFSDEIDSKQDIRGLINVEPDAGIQLSVIGNQALIKGDFKWGEDYELIVQPGLRSRWATKTEKQLRETVRFEDMLPKIRFASDGVFLPSANQSKILFQTVNISRVKLEIMRVFENNLGQFLQTERLDGNRERRGDLNYQMNRVGVTIAEKELVIGSERNRWLQHELDLKQLLKDDASGLFLISISFEREDMLYDTSEDNLRYSSRRRSYYNDPATWGYIYRHGRILKPVILSDIGLTYKKGNGAHYVFATNLLNTAPLSGVMVRLKTYQNQLIAEGFTDGQGFAEFTGIDEDVFYVEAKKGSQRSVIKPGEMSWNLSAFDTEGMEIPETGLRAFIYTSRGVYRPGDTVHVALIVRNEQNTFPENHPVTMEVFNPKDQLVFREINKKGSDGFYSFIFSTAPDDLTGNYMAKIKAGSQEFAHEIKIETVAPERLKVELEAEKESITWEDQTLLVTLKSQYLFGNPAAGLRAEVEALLLPEEKQFDKYRDYVFSDQTRRFQPQRQTLFEKNLNERGQAEILWTLPVFDNVPCALRARIEAKVYEKGGRAAKNALMLDVDPYPFYVGLKEPEGRYGYVGTGSAVEVPVILLDPRGREEAGRTLKCTIYRNETHWWWEYDSRDNFRLRFRQDESTKKVKEMTVVSGSNPRPVTFTPQERGEYLIEVQDGEKGHTSAIFIRAYPWGEAPSEGKDAGILALKADKEKYHPGETAKVTFPAPGEAAILMTVEKGGAILEKKWLKADGKSAEQSLEVNVTEAMLPTAYVSVSVIQPHAQTVNDRPMRLYGIVPLNVEKKETRQEINILMADALESNKPFEVEIRTADGEPAQLTVAVVDEGLLSLTRFQTPDPWQAFFKKQRLSMVTSDLFSQIIGVNKGDIFRTFSIGGGLAEDAYHRGQLDQQKVRRFKPVCLFEGPLWTDGSGRATIEFNMPEYIGAVRVMAAAANGNRYGNAEKTVPVKTDLMIMPTLPRVLSPGDEITVPVTVFAMREGIGGVDVSIRVEGPLEIIGEGSTDVSFSKSGEKDVQFRLKAAEAVGTAKIIIEAASSKMTARSETEISVRAASPRITEAEEREILPGASLTFKIPDKGLAGSNQANISIKTRPNLKLNRRILWLIRYPYGCIEQTVSASFAQLYLPEFIPQTRDAKRDIDKNINATIKRLRKFQLPSGGFAYWPGNDKVSDWGSSYAGHFMIEARKLGYSIPDRMLDQWIGYQQSAARLNDDNLMMQLYRLYTLALAGEPAIGAMNLLNENKLDDMNDPQKWLLAAAYHLAGISGTANRILISAGTTVKDYQEFGGTYGSAMRDKAIILEQMTTMERWEDASQLAGELAVMLSAQEWYSTQTTGYTLLALGKFFKAVEGDEDVRLSGRLHLPDGRKIGFNSDKLGWDYAIQAGFGEELKIELDQESTVKRAFVTLEWSGLPPKWEGKDESQNLNLTVEWRDEDGMPVDPRKLLQGETMWAIFKVSKPKGYDSKIEELALVQILPSGWEIDNVRLSGEQMPRWMQSYKLNQEEYLDIRDDRVMWFFDLPAYQSTLDFAVKINAVTIGEFFLPPTWLEAMYNNHYRASKKGMTVTVEER